MGQPAAPPGQQALRAAIAAQSRKGRSMVQVVQAAWRLPASVAVFAALAVVAVACQSGADAAEIVYVSDVGDGLALSAMAADGSGQRHLGNLEDLPFVLSPQGSRVAFLGSADAGGEGLIVMNVDGSDQRQLVALGDDVPPTWSPDGNWLAYTEYAEDDISWNSDYEVFVVAADGDSAAQQVTRNSDTDDFVWWGVGAWSPDSASLAIMRELDTTDAAGRSDDYTKIFVIDRAGTSERQLVPDSDSEDGFPAWSPDGAKIAYISFRDHAMSLWVIGADGSEAREFIADYRGRERPPVWSPDSTRLAFYDDADDALAITVIGADGSGLRTLVESIVSPRWWGHPPVWSPDGSAVAFSDSRDGDSEIFVVDVDGGNLRQLTDNDTDDYLLAWS